MEDKEIFIHIGFPKTGTRSLQYHIFHQNEEVALIGYPEDINNSLKYRLTRVILRDERHEFDPSQVKKELLYPILNHTHKDKVIVSNENFSTAVDGIGVDRYTVAERLKKLFPKGKIIVIIRNQFDILKSHYLQKLKNNKKFNLSFKEWLDKHYEFIYTGNIFNWYKYDKILDIYHKLFGKDNVLVLKFEDHVKKGDLSMLQDFINIKGDFNLDQNKHRNKTITNTQYVTDRIIDKVNLRSTINMLPESFRNNVRDTLFYKIGKKINIQYPDEYIDFINEYYAESNKRLEEKANISLSKKNYPL